jgi:hypothetical protein
MRQGSYLAYALLKDYYLRLLPESAIITLNAQH